MYTIKNPIQFRENVRLKFNEKLILFIEQKNILLSQSTSRGPSSTLRPKEFINTEKIIFGYDDVSYKNVNLPLQATAICSSSTLRSEESLNFDSVASKSVISSSEEGNFSSTSFSPEQSVGENVNIEKLSDFSTNRSGENVKIISTNLEKGVYNYAIKEANNRMIIKKWENTKFTQLYIDRFRTIFLNLKNEEFIEKIITLQIKPLEYTKITHQDISPEKWQGLIEQNSKKEESLLSVNIKANTDLYTCRKCKSRNIYFTETQTRSADEQSTITLLCLTCGKRWTHG